MVSQSGRTEGRDGRVSDGIVEGFCMGMGPGIHFRILPYCWPELFLNIADAVAQLVSWHMSIVGVDGKAHKSAGLPVRGRVSIRWQGEV